MKKLELMENENIRKMKVAFSSLEKKPFEFNFDKGLIKLPDLFLNKSIGIYCELGEVTDPKPINIKIFDRAGEIYDTKILPITGKDVTLFCPFFIFDSSFTMKINDQNQCKSFTWSDLQDWKGPFWEGTYDKTLLKE